MAALPIPSSIAYEFTQTEKAARRAARLWFTGAPTLTLSAWRDARCQEHCSGLPGSVGRADTFRKAFAQELGAIIAGGSHE